jgi:hypothetical protein
MHVEPRRGGGTQVSFRLPVESSQQSAELLTPESSSKLTADS